MGLAISQSFARMMGGDITVDSQLGVGSVFKLKIEAELLESQKLNKSITARRVSKLQPGQKSYKNENNNEIKQCHVWHGRSRTVIALCCFGVLIVLQLKTVFLQKHK